MKRQVEWFKNAKYGLFIHWGLYSILAGEYKGVKTNWNAEWILNSLDIPVEEYRKLAEQFDPVNFNAEDIVKKAKSWGMSYIVFTAKHHEGFAMYASSVDPYNSQNAPKCRRDFVKELQVACEKYDMRLGLYYSQTQDWDDPNGISFRKNNEHKNFQKYFEEKCLPQIKELLTNYGKISLMWFDTPLDIEYNQSKQIVDLVNQLQPECIINGRVGNDLGDYITMGDDGIPRSTCEKIWEVPATLNNTWGYNKDANKWKNAKEIIQLMVKINARGGNYLLNIGPDMNGDVPKESIEILDEVGAYVSQNEEAFKDTSIMPTYCYETTWGDFTCKKNRLYVHIFKPRKIVELNNMKAVIKNAYILRNKQEIPFTSARSCGKNWALRFELPEEMYEETYYCVCLELEEDYPIMEDIQ